MVPVDPSGSPTGTNATRTTSAVGGLIDFDDLLGQCCAAIGDPSFAAAQRWRFRHLFVDEYQDVNPLQERLLRAWLGDRSDLCVVGDPNQAIYSWNGADPRFLTEFARRTTRCRGGGAAGLVPLHPPGPRGGRRRAGRRAAPSVRSWPIAATVRHRWWATSPTSTRPTGSPARRSRAPPAGPAVVVPGDPGAHQHTGGGDRGSAASSDGSLPGARRPPVPRRARREGPAQAARPAA